MIILTKTTVALMLFPFLAAFAALVLYIIKIINNKNRALKLCGHYVYSFPDLPIIGNALKLMRFRGTTDFWNFVSEVTSEHRKGLLLSVFHLNWICIQEVDVVEIVLSSQEACDKSYVYSLLDIVTDGVFACNGIRWRKLRKKLNLTFSQKQIDSYSNDINEQTAICIKTLKKCTGKYFNIQAFLTTYFVDIIFRTHFGMPTEEQHLRKYQITEAGAKVIELTMEKRFFNVFIHPKFIFKKTQMYKFIADLRARPLRFIRKTIGQRLKIVDSQEEKAMSVDEKKEIPFYVEMVREVLQELNLPATPYHIERNTSDLIVAASDTTSVAVGSALNYLALYQEIQEKVYQEALGIFGESSTKNLTKEDLNNMQYLEMVIKETLRLTAPPGIVRELTEDMDVGKYILPKGINVYVVMKAIHENPAYWDKPDQFYPEHFLPEKVSARPKYAFIPFSSGPRNCPGKVFSYVTMKTIISSIVRNFKIETDVPLEKIKFKMCLMQEHENGFSLKLTSRLP